MKWFSCFIWLISFHLYLSHWDSRFLNVLALNDIEVILATVWSESKWIFVFSAMTCTLSAFNYLLNRILKCQNRLIFFSTDFFCMVQRDVLLRFTIWYLYLHINVYFKTSNVTIIDILKHHHKKLNKTKNDFDGYFFRSLSSLHLFIINPTNAYSTV